MPGTMIKWILCQFLIWIGNKERRSDVAESRHMFAKPNKSARSWDWDDTTFRL